MESVYVKMRRSAMKARVQALASEEHPLSSLCRRIYASFN